MKKKTDWNKIIKKYITGGEINTASNIIGAGLSFIPGGQAVAPLIGMLGQQLSGEVTQNKILQDHFNSIQTGNNPYGTFKEGGEITGYSDLIKYSGMPSHNNGGVSVNKSGLPMEMSTDEVEKDETTYRVGNTSYVFSNKFKL